MVMLIMNIHFSSFIYIYCVYIVGNGGPGVIKVENTGVAAINS